MNAYSNKEFDQEQTSTVNSYDGDVAKFGTVVSVAGSTIIYAVGSVYIDMHDGSKTIKNFVNTDQVQVFDTQKDANGDAIAANGYNAVFTDTGANITFSNTPVAVTANTHHGTLTEKVTC